MRGERERDCESFARVRLLQRNGGEKLLCVGEFQGCERRSMVVRVLSVAGYGKFCVYILYTRSFV